VINCMTTRGNEAILKSSDGTRMSARENRLSARLVPWYVCQGYPMTGGLALEMHAPIRAVRFSVGRVSCV
jgi:hypothetical protein